MLINLLFRKLKNFYYTNMLEHKVLVEIYKYNKVTKDELLDICNLNINYFETYSKLEKKDLSSSDKLFLVMTQDILNFLNLNRSSPVALNDIINDYYAGKDALDERCKYVYLEILKLEAVSEIVNSVLDINSYFHGNIIQYISGNISKLNIIEIISFDPVDTIRNKLIKLIPPTIYGEKKINKFKIENNKITIIYKNTQFIINCINPMAYDKCLFDFTIETIMVNVATGEIKDNEYAVYELYNRFLNPCSNLYEYNSSVVHKWNYTKERKYRNAFISISPKIIIKYFKYSEHYKSQKKLKRFMKNALMYNHKKFSGQQLLDMVEYFLKGY